MWIWEKVGLVLCKAAVPSTRSTSETIHDMSTDDISCLFEFPYYNRHNGLVRTLLLHTPVRLLHEQYRICFTCKSDKRVREFLTALSQKQGSKPEEHKIMQ